MSHYPRQYGRYRQHSNPRGNKVFFGLVIILVGVFLMLKKLHLLPYFDLRSFWPVILIAIGLFIGVQKRFRNNAWWILTLIGVAYLVPEFMILGTSSANLVLPAALILGGLLLVLRSKKKGECMDATQVVTSDESSLSIDVTFGGRKEIVTSKEFRGGNISTTFGGAEINLIQADSTVQPMVLNLTVSFGGVEIIVPSHWELQNEIEPTFGSVEDHRTIRTPAANEEKKTLILRGSCNFGSIEIKSY